MTELAAAHSTSPLRFTTVWNLMWDFRHRRLAEAHAAVTAEVVNHRKAAAGRVEHREPVPYHVSGPRLQPDDRQATYAFLVSIWKESSIQLDRLCRGFGMRYLHFLQPNQYVEGSKPMGAEERRTAWSADQLYRSGVERGYPLLIEAGRELRAGGVDFHDLTRVFAGVEQPLYNDDCCHFGREGYEIVTRHVARALVAAVEREP
jgi:hypothetical protein